MYDVSFDGDDVQGGNNEYTKMRVMLHFVDTIVEITFEDGEALNNTQHISILYGYRLICKGF